MTLRDFPPNTRAKWPAQFDIEGVERSHDVRKQLLDQERQMYTTKNDFIDINNPPTEPYVHQPFPTTVYHHGDEGHVRIVKTEEELGGALKAGFKRKPSLRHDYSQIRGGRAPLIAAEPEAETVETIETAETAKPAKGAFLNKRERKPKKADKTPAAEPEAE